MPSRSRFAEALNEGQRDAEFFSERERTGPPTKSEPTSNTSNVLCSSCRACRTASSPRRLSRFSGQAARCQAAAVPHRCGCRCDFPSILAQTSLAGASHTFKPSTLATTQTATPAAATPAAATPAAATPAATARQTLSQRGGEGDRPLNRVETINDATARAKPPNQPPSGKRGSMCAGSH